MFRAMVLNFQRLRCDEWHGWKQSNNSVFSHIYLWTFPRPGFFTQCFKYFLSPTSSSGIEFISHEASKLVTQVEFMVPVYLLGKEIKILENMGSFISDKFTVHVVEKSSSNFFALNTLYGVCVVQERCLHKVNLP